MNAPSPSIAVPPTWRRRTDLEHGVVVTARARELPPSGVAPEMTLHLTPGVDRPLEAWRDDVVHELAGLLERFEVEDDDLFDLAGAVVAYHRWAHVLGTADVLCEQWSWLVGGVGVTLTCSVAREDYPVYCDVFEAAAATLDLTPMAA